MSLLLLAANSARKHHSVAAISPFSLLHFDGTNGSTTITDQVAGNTWTAAGGAKLSTAQSRFGGSSAFFNGSSSYIASNRPALDFKFLHDGTTPWTLEGFVYRVGSVAQYFADTGGAATASVGFIAGINASGLFDVMIARGVSNSYAARATGGAIPANQWTYVKVACDGTNLKTFVAGVAATAVALSSPSTADPATTFNFGRYASGNSLYYNGYLDEMKLTKGFADFSTAVPASPFSNPI